VLPVHFNLEAGEAGRLVKFLDVLLFAGNQEDLSSFWMSFCFCVKGESSAKNNSSINWFSSELFLKKRVILPRKPPSAFCAKGAAL